MQLTRISWTDAGEYLKRSRTILVPLGSVEQHGPGMPLGTDAIIASALAREAAARTDSLVGPPLCPGVSLVPHMEYPGAISFMPDTYTAMIREYIASLHSHGFRNFIFVNGHGGNGGSIQNAMIEMRYRLNDIKFKSGDWWRMKGPAELSMEIFGRPVGHGCAAEVSIILFLSEELADSSKFTSESTPYTFLVSNNLARDYITETGLMNADQTLANPVHGQKIFEAAVDEYVKMIKEIESSNPRRLP